MARNGGTYAPPSLLGIINEFICRQYRTVLSPPFHFDVVRQWIPEFHQLSIDLMNLWKPLVNMGPIDLMHWMPLFTLDVLGTTVLSRSFNAMQGKADKELIAVNTILQTGQKPSTVAKAIVSVNLLFVTLTRVRLRKSLANLS